MVGSFFPSQQPSKLCGWTVADPSRRKKRSSGVSGGRLTKDCARIRDCTVVHSLLFPNCDGGAIKQFLVKAISITLKHSGEYKKNSSDCSSRFCGLRPEYVCLVTGDQAYHCRRQQKKTTRGPRNFWTNPSQKLCSPGRLIQFGPLSTVKDKVMWLVKFRVIG
ncbi:hypothetical protein BGX38DRAFT_798929 [Terfezia claveryi]|nr:hypothetical protein BGX38DRAFT_798929 [Terfezia claveryi]